LSLSLDFFRFDFDEDLFAACTLVNQSLYEDHSDRHALVRRLVVTLIRLVLLLIFQKDALQLIEREWFAICVPKETRTRSFEQFLNTIRDNFSNFLLERIVNLQDANVSRFSRGTTQIDASIDLGQHGVTLLCSSWPLDIGRDALGHQCL
jgi:hypothetical protein